MSDTHANVPLIVSLQFDLAAFAELDRLRRRHFPAERNHLAAHLTLFHHLPSDREKDIAAQLAAVCDAAPPLQLSLPSVRFLGRGVAINVHCPALVALRAELARPWQSWLTPQDSQPFRPHVTVQNKVDPAVAKALFAQLSSTWTPLDAAGIGLQLWRYAGGPWEAAGSFPFAGIDAQTATRSTDSE